MELAHPGGVVHDNIEDNLHKSSLNERRVAELPIHELEEAHTLRCCGNEGPFQIVVRFTLSYGFATPPTSSRASPIRPELPNSEARPTPSQRAPTAPSRCRSVSAKGSAGSTGCAGARSRRLDPAASGTPGRCCAMPRGSSKIRQPREARRLQVMPRSRERREWFLTP